MPAMLLQLALLLPLGVAVFRPVSPVARPAVHRPTRRCRGPLLCEGEDWRDVRARLVAQEQKAAPAAQRGDEGTAGFMYESPLIEQGSVILGGTKQDFGFALRQQYFHKSVMLLLQHDESFTKGIILNRPSALELDGWRVWFGGDVAEGGMFRGQSKGEREIVCLHSLQSEEAARLSLPVIRGVSQTTLEGAQSLVSKGSASKSDFWLFVGYAGWAPEQLQGEVERDSWYLAAADSSVLLGQLLEQGTTLPPPSQGEAAAGDGLLTWERLMTSIGKADEVERTRGNIEDRMLKEWVRTYLLPPKLDIEAQRPPEVAESIAKLFDGSVVGTVLRCGAAANCFTLQDQYLYKALLVVLHQTPQGVTVLVTLNRPTANAVQLNLPGRPKRHISFGGDARVRGNSLDIDSNGLLWLHQQEGLGGTAIGDSGVWRIPSAEAAELIKKERCSLDEFLVVGGVVAWDKEELEKRVAAGEVEAVVQPARLWPQLWTCASIAEGDSLEEPPQLSDGTGLWWASTQAPADRSADQGGGGGGGGRGETLSMPVMPMRGLADEALELWLRFFAGHKPRSDS